MHARGQQQGLAAAHALQRMSQVSKRAEAARGSIIAVAAVAVVDVIATKNATATAAAAPQCREAD